jgi:hypothetical protein
MLGRATGQIGGQMIVELGLQTLPIAQRPLGERQMSQRRSTSPRATRSTKPNCLRCSWPQAAR